MIATNSAQVVASGKRGGKKRILVVDDEKDLVDLISYNLNRNGYDVITADDGASALELASKEQPDLVVLDLMLPGVDGMEVAKQLRADPETASIPIIMLTAKSEEVDGVVGLAIGADDYITKPFSMKILLARLNTVLRRQDGSSGAPEATVLRCGNLVIDTSRHEVRVGAEPIKLTLTEFKLLSALLSARGRVLSRDQLMTKAMGSGVFVTDRAIDVHVTAIRKKLGGASAMIHTVRGVGYRLRESGDEPE